jgi:hypothetical protein
MKYSDLAHYKHHSASISPRDLWVRTTTDGIQQASKSITTPSQSTQYGDDVLDLTAAEDGSGMWVPYQAKSAVWDYLGKRTWVASGPYSGCYFVVGRHAGRIFAAHVSCEAANDAGLEAWNESEMSNDILFTKKIGMAKEMPLGTTNAAAICFAHVAGATVKVTRIDVRTESAGGMSGAIFAVNELESD